MTAFPTYRVTCYSRRHKGVVLTQEAARLLTHFCVAERCVGSPEKSALPYFDDENKNYALSRLSAVDAFLLGRVTYEKFAARWSQIKGDDYFDRINSLPKFIASSLWLDLVY